MVPQGSGSIINTSSIAGVIGGLGGHAYTTAKTAVVGLTKSVASELGPKGVRCNAIAPGTVPTALTAAMLGDVNDLDAVAEQSRERYGRVERRDRHRQRRPLPGERRGGYVSGHTLVVDYAPQHQRRLGALRRFSGERRYRRWSASPAATLTVR